MKRVTLAAIAASAIFLTACGDDEEGEQPSPTVTLKTNQVIFEYACGRTGDNQVTGISASEYGPTHPIFVSCADGTIRYLGDVGEVAEVVDD